MNNDIYYLCHGTGALFLLGRHGYIWRGSEHPVGSGRSTMEHDMPDEYAISVNHKEKTVGYFVMDIVAPGSSMADQEKYQKCVNMCRKSDELEADILAAKQPACDMKETYYWCNGISFLKTLGKHGYNWSYNQPVGAGTSTVEKIMEDGFAYVIVVRHDAKIIDLYPLEIYAPGSPTYNPDKYQSIVDKYQSIVDKCRDGDKYLEADVLAALAERGA